MPQSFWFKYFCYINSYISYPWIPWAPERNHRVVVVESWAGNQNHVEKVACHVVQSSQILPRLSEILSGPLCPVEKSLGRPSCQLSSASYASLCFFCFGTKPEIVNVHWLAPWGLGQICILSKSKYVCFLKYVPNYTTAPAVFLNHRLLETYAWVLSPMILVIYKMFRKVENILKGSLDLIPSPSSSVKIQIMGGKVCLMCKGKTLLGIVNKLLKTKSLLTSPSIFFAFLPK